MHYPICDFGYWGTGTSSKEFTKILFSNILVLWICQLPTKCKIILTSKSSNFVDHTFILNWQRFMPQLVAIICLLEGHKYMSALLLVSFLDVNLSWFCQFMEFLSIIIIFSTRPWLKKICMSSCVATPHNAVTCLAKKKYNTVTFH